MKRFLSALILCFMLLSGVANADYQVKDAAGVSKYFKTSSGAGTSGDPFYQLHVLSAGTAYAGKFRLTDGTNDSSFSTALADALSNTNNFLPVSAYALLYNGTTFDRFRSIINANNTIGTGILAAGILSQFDDVAPTSITENQFGNLRMSANRNLYSTIRDAAGNERGANVNASSQLSVSVDNTVTVASHAVTAISGGIAAGAIAAGATSFVKLEDAASADADAGVPALARRTASPANTSGSDLDYEVLQMAAGRLWTSSNIDQINGVTPLMGNGVTGTGSMRVTLSSDTTANSNPFLVAGGVASGAADSGNPVKIAGVARNAAPAATSNGNRIDLYSDLAGRPVVTVGAPRELKAWQQTTITSSAAETTIVTAGGSGVFNDLTSLTFSNSSATATLITLKDSTAGTTRSIISLAGGQNLVIPMVDGNGVQSSSNANWTVTCGTSVASIYVTAQFNKNK